MQAENARVRAEVAAAQETIAALTGQVAALLERVKEPDGQRATDSHNSGKPPSSGGPARVPRSLRRASGQAGHRGACLRLVETPDHVVVRRPLVCPGCAASPVGGAVEGMERRQVVEMPPARALVTACRGLRVRCPHCQAPVTGPSPPP